MAETMPSLASQGWLMVLARAKTPGDVVQRLGTEIGTVPTDPEVQKTASTLGCEIDSKGSVTPDAAADYLKKELASSGKIIQEIGLDPQ
jgi:tripartite-type tricarboxylate transporter receptor subunit TctC